MVSFKALYYHYRSLYRYIIFILLLFKGKLCDASARYEKAIQEEPGEIGHHKVKMILFNLL